MSEQDTGTSAVTGDQAGSQGAAASADAAQQQRQSTLPPSVMARFSELSTKRKQAESNAAEERRRREAAEAELARLRAQLGGGDGGAAAGTQGATQAGTAGMTPEQLDRVIDDAANRKLTQKETEQAVRRIEAEGRKLFPNWEQAIEQFGVVGGIPASMFSAIARVDNAHEVLFSLANDLDRAAQLFELDPVSQGIELAKLQQETKAARAAGGAQLSRTPAPLEPVGGRAPGLDKDPDDMDNDEWFAMRERQVRDSRQTRRS